MSRPLNDNTPTAWLLVLPAVAGLIAFVAVPFFLAIGLSLTDLRLGSPLPIEFAGLRQYRRIFTDPSFQRALINNGIFALVVVPVQTTLALGLALLLNRGLCGMAVYRTLFFMPVVFPMALVAVVWELIFAPGATGTLNSFFSTITFGWWEPKAFLHDPYLALPAIMLLSVWQGLGFQMVILLAGLQAIPDQLYEAASIDGAGVWRTLVEIILPNAKPAFAAVAITTFLMYWGLYLWPLMVTTHEDVRPLPLAVATFRTLPPLKWADIMAFAVMMVGPVLVVFIVFQRWFVRGVATSGIKG